MLGPGSLLGVDFGDYTSEEDERRAVIAPDDTWAEPCQMMRKNLP